MDTLLPLIIIAMIVGAILSYSWPEDTWPKTPFE